MAYQSGAAFDELSAFVAVVDANGFSSAARASGARKATLSLRVQQLEARLGVALLVRTTRSLRLTDEGSAYLDHARRAVTAANDAEAAVALARTKPRGRLRITAPGAVAAEIFEPVVAPYLAENPEVSIDLDTSTRTVDLVREGYDLALRVAPLADSTLVARRLGTTHGGYYASPKYLAKRRKPRDPDALDKHDTIVVPKGDAAHASWPFIVGGKTKLRPITSPRLYVTNFDVAAEAAALGLGILRSPSHYVRRYLVEKRLVPVLERFTPPPFDLYAVFPPGASLVPKTRVFLERVAAWFADQRP